MNIHQTTRRKNPKGLNFQLQTILEGKINERNIFNDLLL
jgi:hypothetical protein